MSVLCTERSLLASWVDTPFTADWLPVCFGTRPDSVFWSVFEKIQTPPLIKKINKQVKHNIRFCSVLLHLLKGVQNVRLKSLNYSEAKNRLWYDVRFRGLDVQILSIRRSDENIDWCLWERMVKFRFLQTKLKRNEQWMHISHYGLIRAIVSLWE